MNDLKYGEPVCYEGWPSLPHDDGLVIFLGFCGHSVRDGGGWGLIDIMSVPEGVIDHKDAGTWRHCTHLPQP